MGEGKYSFQPRLIWLILLNEISLHSNFQSSLKPPISPHHTVNGFIAHVLISFYRELFAFCNIFIHEYAKFAFLHSTTKEVKFFMYTRCSLFEKAKALAVWNDDKYSNISWLCKQLCKRCSIYWLIMKTTFDHIVNPTWMRNPLIQLKPFKRM